MCTEKQKVANGANAQFSSGPKTQEGKDISKRNSLKEGLTSKGFVKPAHFANEVMDQAAGVDGDLSPDNSLEHASCETIAHHRVLAEEARRLQVVRRQTIAFRAEVCWDEDRRLEAEVLAEGLARRPAAVVKQLQRTKQGCNVLIDYWKQLDDLLVTCGEWNPEQRALALDLLGVHPALRTGTTVLDAPADAPPFVHLKKVVLGALDQLAFWKEDHLDALDEAERQRALSGAVPEDHQLTLYRRYERENESLIMRLRKQFGSSPRLHQPDRYATMPRRSEQSAEDWHARMDEFRAEVDARNEVARAHPRPDPDPAPQHPPEGLTADYKRAFNAWRVRKGFLPMYKETDLPAVDPGPLRHDAALTDAVTDDVPLAEPSALPPGPSAIVSDEPAESAVVGARPRHRQNE